MFIYGIPRSPSDLSFNVSLITLYTDASVNQCRGVGGFAVVSEYEALAVGVELSRATSTRLEGLAVATAMYLACTEFSDSVVTIYTDSRLWVDRCANFLYLRDNGWRSRCGKRARDIDILTSMLAYYEQDRISVRWVKAHSGVPGNDFADRVAKDAHVFAQEIKCATLPVGRSV